MNVVDPHGHARQEDALAEFERLTAERDFIKRYDDLSLTDEHACQIDPNLFCPCDQRCCLFPKEWEALE